MKRTRVWLLLLIALSMVIPRLTGIAAPLMGDFLLERVSLGNDESEGNDLSGWPSVTFGGVFVAFESDASNLVPTDTNGYRDVFVRGVSSGITERVSVSSTGAEGNIGGQDADISDSGQYVVFTSSSNNLVVNDNNSKTDIYLRDRVLDTTTLITEGTTGNAANGWSSDAKISPDGAVVVFSSDADDLVAGDTNGVYDCFVQDIATGARLRLLTSTGDELDADCEEPDVSDGTRRMVFSSEATNIVPNDTNGVEDVFVVGSNNANIRRVSVSSTGEEANDSSHQVSLSESGLFVVFTSDATNLVANDTNNLADVFVHNLPNGTTQRVSVTSDGSQVTGQSIMPFISHDGRYVLFSSTGSNLPGGGGGARYQVYIHDRVTGITELVSKDENGTSGSESSLHASFSGDNHVVVFDSRATNLVPDDTNGEMDVFRSDIGVFPPPTATPTVTPPPSLTPTGTLTPPTSTPSPSPSPTLDPTEFPPTGTPTGTLTPPTNTPTPTLDPTEFPFTATPTGTLTPSGNTPTPDPTEFPSTATPTGTITPSTSTPTIDPTEFPATPTPTPTGTITPLNHRLLLPLIQRGGVD